MQRTGNLLLAVIFTVPGSTLAWGQQAGSQPETLASGGIAATPWFRDPAIRKELSISDDQYDRLDKGYTLAWRRYQNGVAGLAKLSGKERLDKLDPLAADFHRDVTTTSSDVLSGRQTQRFNELYVQYRGYDALLGDPTIRKRLVLSDTQAEQMRRYAAEYERDLSGILRNDKDRAAALKQYEELRRVVSTRINSALDKEQRQAWRAITGSPYNFQPDFSRPITKD